MIFLQDLCVLQKVKERCCFRHAICCTPWNFLDQTRCAFLFTSPMFQEYVEVCRCNHMPHMLKPAVWWICIRQSDISVLQLAYVPVYSLRTISLLFFGVTCLAFSVAKIPYWYYLVLIFFSVLSVCYSSLFTPCSFVGLCFCMVIYHIILNSTCITVAFF